MLINYWASTTAGADKMPAREGASVADLVKRNRRDARFCHFISIRIKRQQRAEHVKVATETFFCPPQDDRIKLILSHVLVHQGSSKQNGCILLTALEADD